MKIFRNALNSSMQRKLVLITANLIKKSPLFRPTLPRWGNPFKILITNVGKWGWIADKKGYRYEKTHPLNGKKWPAIPMDFLKIWKKFTHCNVLPNCAIINIYEKYHGRLGIHQDKDENDFSFPILFFSLGNSAIFNYGKTKQSLESTILNSGSVVVFRDDSRLLYHSISKVFYKENNLFEKFEKTELSSIARISISMRVFTEKKKI